MTRFLPQSPGDESVSVGLPIGPATESAPRRLHTAAIRSCTVSYQDLDGVTHSVDVTAETLYEAAILGINALNVSRWHDNAEPEDPGVVLQTQATTFGTVYRDPKATGTVPETAL